MNIVESLDFGAIFITLGVVLGAIVSGLFVGYRYDSPTFHRRANYIGSVWGIVLILFSAFLGSGLDGAETNFWSMPWSFYVATAFPCAVGMAVANIVARSFSLPYPEIVAISIECCYQNTAIATSVAVTMFSDPTERAEAVSVPLFYGFIEAIIIGIYCIWAWKAGWTKAPRDEKVGTVQKWVGWKRLRYSDKGCWWEVQSDSHTKTSFQMIDTFFLFTALCSDDQDI